ncbi:hypothetical protein [Ornithinimicrobium cerasi]|uniref:hypothetical protein n=1 Tax=Ornithinimicrobium cerasi TaxID=2248773 RepID=UPI00137B3DA1|nr:hypothetical protein [Ornithinimicrobium cerasi]
MDDLVAAAEGLIAPAAALLGVVLGTTLSGRREHRQWLRERRFEAYSDVNLAARTVLWRGDEIGRDSAEPDLEAQIAKVRAAMFDLRQAVATVEIIGTVTGIKVARSLNDASAALYRYLSELKGPPEDDAIAIQQARAALGGR